MKNKINAGIIGLGVGEAHIKGYELHPNVTVTALCDFNEEKIYYAKNKYPFLKTYTKAEDLINDSDVDVVTIASFDNDHFIQISECIRQKKHIFVEKPLCLFEDEAKEIRRLLEENKDIKLSSNLILRKSPRFIDLKKRIQTGEFGNLYYLDGDYNYGRIHKLTEGWRGKIPFYSVILGGGVHIIDLLLWLTEERVTEVSAMGNNICTNGSQFKYNDFAVGIMKFQNGMNAKVSANFGCIHPHFHSLSVYGEKATFINTKKEALLYKSRDPELEAELLSTQYPGAAKGELIYSFIDDILGIRQAEVTKEDVFETISVCFAIDKSIETNRLVKVNYI
jgi:predicted dehydrogenase